MSRDRAAELVAASIATKQRLLESGALDAIVDAANVVTTSLAAGGKVLAFGNGGSAADAQHLAAELVGHFEQERPALAAVALTVDSSVITALANDDGFESIFARQVEALGRPGDVAIGISTSGRSANVVRGLEAAAGAGLATVALTGEDAGAVGAAAGLVISIPATSTARVQECHVLAIHIICALVEQQQDARLP